jgi:hypothetical protein
VLKAPWGQVPALRQVRLSLGPRGPKLTYAVMTRASGSPGPRVKGAAQAHALRLVSGAPHPKMGGKPLTRALGSLAVPLGAGVASHLGALLVGLAVAASTGQRLTALLAGWDGKWYLAAASGYPQHLLAGSGNAAQSALGFFPALPALIHLVHLLARAGYLVSGIAVTSLLSLVAPVAVWWALRDNFGRDAANRGTILVFFSPGAFVLAMVYGEGLLITAVAACLVALRRRRWLLAGLSAALASAADPLGLAALAACGVAAFGDLRKHGGLRPLAAPLIAPVGALGFFSFLWAWAGTPFAWFIAQRRGWESGAFLSGIPSAFGFVFQHGFTDINDTVKMLSVPAMLVLLVVFLRARPGPASVAYVLATLVLAAASPIVSWTPRVALRAFPLLGVAGARAPRRFFPAIVGFSALLMAALATMSWGLARPPFTP